MDCIDFEIAVGKKYVNRSGDTVMIMKQVREQFIKPIFVVKILKNGVRYIINTKGLFKGSLGDKGCDIVSVYTLTPNKDHMVLLNLMHEMGLPVFEGKFFDRLMKCPNKPPSFHQAESRLKDLIDGNLVTVVAGKKLNAYEFTPKALALFNKEELSHEPA